METVTIERTGAPALTFTGELIAQSGSRPNNAHPDYSGSPGRWVTYRLYRTEAGAFVAARTFHTRWQGESDRDEAAVLQTEAEVIAFFGQDRWAKELYERAGIANVEEVA